MSEKRNELRDKAEVVAQVAVSVYNKPGGMQIWGDMPNDLEEIADMAQQMSGTDFLIRMPSLGIYITTDESLNSMPITLPQGDRRPPGLGDSRQRDQGREGHGLFDPRSVRLRLSQGVLPLL